MPLRLKSLSTELAIVFASISVALVGLLSWFTFNLISRALEDTVRRDLLNTVDQAVRAIDGELQERVRELETVSLSPTIRDAAVFLSEAHATIPLKDREEEALRARFKGRACVDERPDIARHLKAVQGAHSYISEILLTDRLGIAIGCTRDPGRILHDQETWFQEAVNRGVSLSNLELDPASRTWTYAVALPIPDQGHGPAGVIRAIFNMKAIQDTVASLRIGENGFVMAMGSDGRIFAHPRGEMLWKRVDEIPDLAYLRSVIASPDPRGVLIYQPPIPERGDGGTLALLGTGYAGTGAGGQGGPGSPASVPPAAAAVSERSPASSPRNPPAGSRSQASPRSKRGWVRGSDTAGAPRAAAPERRLADAAGSASLADAASDSWILAYSRMFRPASLGPLGWTVVGTVSRAEVISPIINIRHRVLVIETIFVLLTVPFVWVVSRRVARPLNDLARRADLIAAGDLGVDMHVPSRNEIARLASALASMMDSLRESNRTLGKTNANLERIVGERTSELSDKTRLLEEQGKQVLEASRLKSQFLANMSHELRTPLNAILALSEILGERISGDLNDEQVKQVTIINRSGRNLLRLINDILDLSKIEAGRMEVHIAPLEIRGTIAAVRETIEPLASEKGLRFEVLLDPALPAILRSDDARLRQILVNLLGNAVKFTEKGRVSLEARRVDRVLPGLEPAAVDRRDDAGFWLDLRVNDTGIGIAPEALGKIFDEFQQADGSTTRKFGGTGLGLAISKRLADLMGGEITVESEVGKGSTFHVSIPVERVDDERPASHHEGSPFVGSIEDPADAVSSGTSTPALRSPEGDGPFAMEKGGGDRSSMTGGSPAPGDASSPREGPPSPDGSDPGAGKLPSPPGLQGKPQRISPLLEHPIAASSRFLDIHDDTDNWLAHIPTLLVVDDDPESLYVYRQFLCRQGYQVIFAINGEQVMDKARQFKPAAIVLDLMLPHKSGWEVLEELKVAEDLKEIPVIISSVLDHRERGVCAGAFRYLTKPMSEKQLLGVLKELEKVRRSRLRSVLVVDDDLVEIGIAETLFRKAGLNVTSIQKGSEALEWAAENHPDIIVLDLMMPEMDGFEVLARLRADSRTAAIPVLVYTARDISEEDRSRLLPSALRIFPKVPFQFEEMIEEVNRALQSVPMPGDAARGTGASGGGGIRGQAMGDPASGAGETTVHQGEAMTEPSRPPATRSPKSHRARILLVEDDPANQYSVGFLLRSEGYEVIIAEDGAESLERAESDRPDIILMDMMMPVMSGFDATRRLKQSASLKEIPVIALTAAAMAGDRERTLAAGCDDYISKPIDRRLLLERILHWLAKSKEPAGVRS